MIRKQLFRLSDEEWGRVEPLLPKGRRGARRVDDRRVISGIVHMLGSGARWRAGVRPLHDDLQPFQPMEPPRRLAGHVQGGHRQHRRDRRRLNRQFARQGASLGGRRKRGAFKEGVGRSRGGRTTAIHALADAAGRPRVLLVAPGNVHDVMMAEELLSAAGPIERLIADKAYDTNRLRSFLKERDIEAVIPSSARRKPFIARDREAYRQRNLIERMFARLKDFRRIATRYDKLARNFLAGVLIAAAAIWWT